MIVPLVIVTGQVVKVVTTISVVTRSEVAGWLVVMPPVGVLTQVEPEKVEPSPQEAVLGLTLELVKGTHWPPD